jgi:peptidoglycan/LPS O-acetylase OafA/YrhL
MTNKAVYNPHIDGLRGIAILMVIGYHYLSGLYIFDLGWSGVDLFFVISGYLLTGRLYPYLNDKKLVWKFYFNRFLRIVPLCYTFLIIFFSGWFLFASQSTIDSVPIYKNHLLGFFAFISNWVFISNFSNTENYLQHLWSLAVEEQFYIFFPFFIILIREKKKLLAAGITVIIVIVITRCFYFYLLPNKGHYLKIYWNSFFRFDSFLIGFVLYMIKENNFNSVIERYIKKIAVISFVLLISSFFLTGTFRLNNFFITIGLTIIGVFYSTIIFLTLSSNVNFLKKVTSSKPLQLIGKISYGLYIFHSPIYLLNYTILNSLLYKINIIINPTTLQLTNAFASFIITYFVSLLSFRYYESFFQKFKSIPKLY